MSFLKKFGQVALQVGKVLPTVGPILSAIIPGTKDDAVIARATGAIDPIIKIVTDVEQIGTALSLSGPQKLTAATPLVAAALQPYAATRGIAAPGLFKAGCEKIAAGVVDVLNSLKEPA